MIKVTIELTNDEIKRENEIKNAISDILDCYEIEPEIQIIKKEDELFFNLLFNFLKIYCIIKI